MGIIAAALGIPANEDEAFNALSSSLWVASATHGASRVVADFRTAQATKAPPRKVGQWNGRADAFHRGGVDYTQIGMRQHIEDSLWRCFVTSRGETDELDRLRDALRAPAFGLSLGRRENPLALPVDPVIVEGGLLDAVTAYPAVPPIFANDCLGWMLGDLDRQIARADAKGYDLAWDHGFPDVPEGGSSRQVTDDPASRVMWRFRQRAEVWRRMMPILSKAPEAASVDTFFEQADGA